MFRRLLLTALIRKTSLAALLFLFILPAISFGQSQAYIDSLIQAAGTKTGIGKVDVMLKISLVLRSKSIKQSIYWAKESLKIAEDIGYEAGADSALNLMATTYLENNKFDSSYFYYDKLIKLRENTGRMETVGQLLIKLAQLNRNTGNYAIALDYGLRALKIYEEKNDAENIADACNSIGNTYYFMGQYEKSLKYYFRYLQISEQMNDKRGISYALNNIGQIYRNTDDYNAALSYFNRSLKIKRELADDKGIANTLNNIGITYKYMNKTEEALSNYLEALDIYNKIEDSSGIAYCYNNIGQIFLDRNEFEKALEYFSVSLKIKENFNDRNGIVNTLNNIGKTYQKQKKYQDAEKYFMESLRISYAIESNELIKKAFEHLSKLYEEKQNYSLALLYFKKSDSIKDIINTMESANKIAELQVIYDLNAKEKQNELIVKNNRFQRNFFILIISFILVLLFVFLFRYRANRKTNMLLSRRLQFIQFINETSSNFVNISAEDIDNGIRRTLEKVLDFTGGQNAYIFLKNKETGGYRLSYDWPVRRTDIENNYPEEIQEEEYLPAFKKLRNGVSLMMLVNWPVIKAFTGNMEKAGVSDFNTIFIPLSVGGEFLGFAGFRRTDKVWNEENIRLLRITGELMAGSIRRNMSEKEIIDAKLKAERSDWLKSVFLANMSHDIRTQLNGIIGFTSILREDRGMNDTQLQYLNIIDTSGKQLLSLINDIIDINRIEAGLLEIRETPTQLNKTMTETLRFFETYKKEHFGLERAFVDIRMNSPLDDERALVYTDDSRLRQILNNIVNNALKFTMKGYVEFGYQAEPGSKMLTFYVKDTGVGLSGDQAALIFERFKQADNDLTRKLQGSGLGLAICKQLVGLMGGSIWVESEPGKGSVFYFTLPYKPVNQIRESMQVEFPIQSFNWKNKTILVVDDIYENFEYFTGLLESTGALLLYARESGEALEILQNNKNVDVILMDILLPGVSGLELTGIIKKSLPNIPIVAQTAFAFNEDREKCLKAGCDEYLSKPISQNALFEILDQFI